EHAGRLGDRGLEECVVLYGLCQLLRSMSLPGPPFSTRSRFTGRTMASGFRRRYVPNAFSTDWRRKNRAVVEARPDRDSFRRFSRKWVSTDRTCHAAGAGVGHWNVAPVAHIRCGITASLRATAMVAFLVPIRLASACPQLCRAQGRADRLSRTLAASNRRPRTMPSPHFDTLPARSTSPDW